MNKIASMQEITTIEKVDPPEIPKRWDFSTADKDFDKYICKWRRLHIDVISELWVFYNKLKVGHNPKKSRPSNEGQLPTWYEWLASKGIGESTPLRHFKALGWLPLDSLVSKMTGNAENYTPAPVIEKVREVLGTIELDPATCRMAQETVKAETYYTEEDDGLGKPWSGCVFLNPPYGMPQIREFTDKLIEDLPNITEAILLTNDQTDTKWWHKCAINATLICMPKGRLRFYTPDIEETSPTNGQTFFYYGANESKFKKVFSDTGLIMKVL